MDTPIVERGTLSPPLSIGMVSSRVILVGSAMGAEPYVRGVQDPPLCRSPWIPRGIPWCLPHGYECGVVSPLGTSLQSPSNGSKGECGGGVCSHSRNMQMLYQRTPSPSVGDIGASSPMVTMDSPVETHVVYQRNPLPPLMVLGRNPQHTPWGTYPLRQQSQWHIVHFWLHIGSFSAMWEYTLASAWSARMKMRGNPICQLPPGGHPHAKPPSWDFGLHFSH